MCQSENELPRPIRRASIPRLIPLARHVGCLSTLCSPGLCIYIYIWRRPLARAYYIAIDRSSALFRALASIPSLSRSLARARLFPRILKRTQAPARESVSEERRCHPGEELLFRRRFSRSQHLPPPPPGNRSQCVLEGVAGGCSSATPACASYFSNYRELRFNLLALQRRLDLALSSPLPPPFSLSLSPLQIFQAPHRVHTRTECVLSGEGRGQGRFVRSRITRAFSLRPRISLLSFNINCVVTRMELKMPPLPSASLTRAREK